MVPSRIDVVDVGEEELGGTDVVAVVEELLPVGLEGAKGVEGLLVMVVGSSVGVASVIREVLLQQ